MTRTSDGGYRCTAAGVELDYLEVETLGPLARLEPGAAANTSSAGACIAPRHRRRKTTSSAICSIVSTRPRRTNR